MSKFVQYQAESGVAVLTLDDPPRNTYTHETMRELDDAILRARFDDDVHALVLTGAGEESFSEGVHLGLLRSVNARFRYAFALHVSETLRRLEQTPKLVIAALNGSARGGGLELALACDLRVGVQGEHLLGFPEIRRGTLPEAGGMQRLTRLVGRGEALRLLLGGEEIGFEVAREQGILDRVLPAADFRDAVVEMARGYCPPRFPSRAVSVLKRSLGAGADLPLDQALAAERELIHQLHHSQDAREGLAAALEERTPAFQGI